MIMAKKKEAKQKCDILTPILVATGIIVTTVGIFLGYNYYSSPKFSEGDCLINRAYYAVRVESVLNDSKLYTLQPLESFEYYYEGWGLTPTTTKPIYKAEQSYADKWYVKIKCDNN
jgi:hypothetical protein